MQTQQAERQLQEQQSQHEKQPLQSRSKVEKRVLLMMWMGLALTMVTHHIMGSTARLAHAVLAVPRLLAPTYRHLGRQVSLRSVPAVLGVGEATRKPCGLASDSGTGNGGSRKGAAGSCGGALLGSAWGYLALGDDPLLPLRVPGRSPLAFHRMISYRARLMDLFFLHRLQLQV
ncbi:hypothetical protein N2152v2_000358 [Parachlorella kessleri]